jgi:chromosome segregation ATPase
MTEKVDVQIIELQRRVAKLEQLADSHNNVSTKAGHRLEKLEDSTVIINDTIRKNGDQINQLVASMARFNDMIISANKNTDIIKELRDDVTEQTIQLRITQKDVADLGKIPAQIVDMSKENQLAFRSLTEAVNNLAGENNKNSMFTGTMAKAGWLIFGALVAVFTGIYFGG